jgi:hypothetical protein
VGEGEEEVGAGAGGGALVLVEAEADASSELGEAAEQGWGGRRRRDCVCGDGDDK